MLSFRQLKPTATGIYSHHSEFSQLGNRKVQEAGLSYTTYCPRVCPFMEPFFDKQVESNPKRYPHLLSFG